MSDILERLDDVANTADYLPDREIARDAINEIARLRKKVEWFTHAVHTCHDECDRPLCAALRENERLRVQNIQMQAALGYAICADDERHIIPSNPYKCGVCDANRGVHARIERLEAALREVLSWHDYSNDMHKPIEVRAAYMRARAALEDRT